MANNTIKTIRLLAIARHIVKYPKTYNQQVWGRKSRGKYQYPAGCGTTACIAGHAILRYKGPLELKRAIKLDPATSAREILGLSCAQAHDLFNPNLHWSHDWSHSLSYDLITIHAIYASDIINDFVTRVRENRKQGGRDLDVPMLSDGPKNITQ